MMYEWLMKLLGHNQGLRGKFWYSARQDQRKRDIGYIMGEIHINHAKLDNGEIVYYTEMSSEFNKKPFSNHVDAVYLGRGRLYKHNGVLQ